MRKLSIQDQADIINDVFDGMGLICTPEMKMIGFGIIDKFIERSGSRTISIDSAATLFGAIMKSNLTGEPETVRIGGRLVVSWEDDLCEK